MGENAVGKRGDKIYDYGDKSRLDFGWWAQNEISRLCFVKLTDVTLILLIKLKKCIGIVVFVE